MNCLLDTHILIWSHVSSDKLSKTIIQAIANPENTIYVSAISFWEISIKHSLGKLGIRGVEPENFLKYSIMAGFEVLDLKAEVAVSSHNLPRIKIRDPFDRMLAWQAICSDYILLTKDKGFEDYRDSSLKIQT